MKGKLLRLPFLFYQTMKKLNYPLLIIVSALFIVLTSAVNPKSNRTNTFVLAENVYEVDIKNSKINWNIKTSRGANNGELKIKTGAINVDKNKIKNANIELDMTGIVVRSIPPGIINMKAISVMNTQSFFDVGRFPTSLIEITRTTQRSSTSFDVNGFLTIKGRRQPLKFTMEGQFSDGHFEGTAKNITINRKAYDIRYVASGDPAEKELEGRIEDAIDDSFTIDVFLVADKKQENR